MTDCMSCKHKKDIFVPCDWLRQQTTLIMPPCPRYEKDETVREYIERAAAISIIKTAGFWEEEDREVAITCANQTPAADVVEVRHGRWEYVPETFHTYSQLRCTVCGWWTLDPSIQGVYHYCPNCGACMDKEAEHEAN